MRLLRKSTMWTKTRGPDEAFREKGRQPRLKKDGPMRLFEKQSTTETKKRGSMRLFEKKSTAWTKKGGPMKLFEKKSVT